MLGFSDNLPFLLGSFIGRGKGMRDDETLFKYGVTLNELTVWQVSASSFEELPPERHGIFYSSEGLIFFQLLWYEITHFIGHIKVSKNLQIFLSGIIEVFFS